MYCLFKKSNNIKKFFCLFFLLGGIYFVILWFLLLILKIFFDEIVFVNKFKIIFEYYYMIYIIMNVDCRCLRFIK